MRGTNTYKDLSRYSDHKMRCYITPELVLKAVRKQLHRSNAQLHEVEHLVLKCKGIGEQYVRIENLGGLINLKSLAAANHTFSKIDGLQPLINLVSLDLSGNRIQKIEGISSLVHLRELNLADNFIEHIPLHTMFPKNIEAMSLANNRLSTLDDLHNFREMTSLLYIDLRDNAVCEHAHYRSVAAYAALSIRYLDDVEVTEMERSAAIYHWDRKGLRPLESELKDSRKEAAKLKRELDLMKSESSQKDGQLEALSTLLKMTTSESQTTRKDKESTENCLAQREETLSDMRTMLLQTKSDFEFLKIELETLYPDAAKAIIDKCTNTLPGIEVPNVESSAKKPPTQAAVSPPSPPTTPGWQNTADRDAGQSSLVPQSLLKRYDDISGNAEEQSAPRGSLLKKYSELSSRPSPATVSQQQYFQGNGLPSPAPSAPKSLLKKYDELSGKSQQPDTLVPQSLVRRYDDKQADGFPPSHSPPPNASVKGKSVTNSSVPDAKVTQSGPNIPLTYSSLLEKRDPMHRRQSGASEESLKRTLSPHEVLMGEGPVEVSMNSSFASASPSVVTSAAASVDVKFMSLIRKALHCEKCAEAYEKKRLTELRKCSPDHVLGELQISVPGFTKELTEKEIVAFAHRKLEFHKQRSTWCLAKYDECMASCNRYLRRARDLVPEIS